MIFIFMVITFSAIIGIMASFIFASIMGGLTWGATIVGAVGATVATVGLLLYSARAS